MFENPQIRQMNWPKMFRTKSLSDELFLHGSSKVQNLTVFSIIYMIRFRFIGPGELIQNGFRVHGTHEHPGCVSLACEARLVRSISGTKVAGHLVVSG